MDAREVRKDFPILDQEVNGQPLSYLDNAATSQKPRQVINELKRFFEEDNANVHRSVHTLGERSTVLYEGARGKVAEFIGAPSPRGVVFTKSATEGLNLLAYAWARRMAPAPAGSRFSITKASTCAAAGRSTGARSTSRTTSGGT